MHSIFELKCFIPLKVIKEVILYLIKLLNLYK